MQGNNSLKPLLYRLDSDGVTSTAKVMDAVGHMFVPNGTKFSQDGKKFYIVDSINNVPMKYDYDVDAGVMSKGMPIRDGGIDGMLDGSCIDNAGMIWWACQKAGKIIRMNPRTGVILDSLKIGKINDVTMPMFGGPGLRTMLVTSTKDFGDSSVFAGMVTLVRFPPESGVKGVPQIKY